MVLLKPTYLIDGDITDIDIDRLCTDGVQGLIFDLDSTLIAPRSGSLTPQVTEWLLRARGKFKLAVVTNNNKEPYCEKVRELLQMPFISRAAKPRRGAFFRALEILDLPAEQVAVVGDRPLTDILGGKRAGMKTILVQPLKTMNEPSWILFFRRLERCFIKS